MHVNAGEGLKNIALLDVRTYSNARLLRPSPHSNAYKRVCENTTSDSKGGVIPQ